MRLSLTKRGDYAIRLLLRLAAEGPGHRATTNELAAACDIPRGNVPTIVNVLARAGILTNTPGPRGGCSLARDPAEVSILEIIEAIEGPMEASNCLLDSRRCHDKDRECALHDAWSKGREAAITALARTSLANAAARERQIARSIS